MSEQNLEPKIDIPPEHLSYKDDIHQKTGKFHWKTGYKNKEKYHRLDEMDDDLIEKAVNFCEKKINGEYDELCYHYNLMMRWCSRLIYLQDEQDKRQINKEKEASPSIKERPSSPYLDQATIGELTESNGSAESLEKKE